MEHLLNKVIVLQLTFQFLWQDDISVMFTACYPFLGDGTSWCKFSIGLFITLYSYSIISSFLVLVMVMVMVMVDPEPMLSTSIMKQEYTLGGKTSALQGPKILFSK